MEAGTSKSSLHRSEPLPVQDLRIFLGEEFNLHRAWVLTSTPMIGAFFYFSFSANSGEFMQSGSC
jgi:hypothetical protein